MPRYYFDLVDDRTVYDSKGVSLPTSWPPRRTPTFARELMETKAIPSANPGGLESPRQQRTIQTDPQRRISQIRSPRTSDDRIAHLPTQNSAEDHVEDVLDIDPAGQPSEPVSRMPQLLGDQFLAGPASASGRAHRQRLHDLASAIVRWRSRVTSAGSTREVCRRIAPIAATRASTPSPVVADTECTSRLVAEPPFNPRSQPRIDQIGLVDHEPPRGALRLGSSSAAAARLDRSPSRPTAPGRPARPAARARRMPSCSTGSSVVANAGGVEQR